MPYVRKLQLGAGFFGEVWQEYDDSLHRMCAAKYLDLTRVGPAANVFAEAQTMIAAAHDNVVAVYSADEVAGQPVIRMEYLSEGSVADKQHGLPVPVAEAVWILEEACRGVEHLHAKGLLHRDVKPANLLLAEKHVKVSDFGLACWQADAPTAPDVAYRTHCPPEAIAVGSGIETVAGDVYALGVTAYRLVNGDDVLSATYAALPDLNAAICSGAFPDRTVFPVYVHDSLRRAIIRAMHPNPARRYPSAAAFRHALEAARPSVSWQPMRSSPHPAWQGLGQDETEWRVEIEPRARSGYEVTVSRRLPGRAWRRHTADYAKSATLDLGIAHASGVMRRLAATQP